MRGVCCVIAQRIGFALACIEVAARPHIKPNAVRFCPKGVGLVRERLRSGPKTGRLGCIWCTEADGFCCRFPAVRGQVRSYEKREIADQRNVARPAAAKRASARRACGLVRDGLRSSPKTGQLGFVWQTEAAGFAVGSRQFADKRSVARFAHKYVASPGPLLHFGRSRNSEAPLSCDALRRHACPDAPRPHPLLNRLIRQTHIILCNGPAPGL